MHAVLRGCYGVAVQLISSRYTGMPSVKLSVRAIFETLCSRKSWKGPCSSIALLGWLFISMPASLTTDTGGRA